MNKRFQMVWVKAREKSGSGYHRGLYKTEEGERIGDAMFIGHQFMALRAGVAFRSGQEGWGDQ